MTERRTASAVLGAGAAVRGEGESDREFVAAQARDDRVAGQAFVERRGNGSQEPLAHLIAMLVVDRLEAMHLDRDDDQIVARAAGSEHKPSARSAKPLRLKNPVAGR